jgi:hypothetical protein
VLGCRHLRKSRKTLGEITMRNYLETSIKTVEDLFTIKQIHLSDYIFRGQQNSKWPLATSLERIMKSKFGDFFLEDVFGMEFWEKQMIEQFQRKFQIYSNNQIHYDDYIQWINLMQHYGSPTRLLDFTESFYIALYFSCTFNENESSVFFVNHNKLHNNTLEILDIIISEDEMLTMTMHEMTEKIPNTIIANQINLIKNSNNFKLSVLPYFPKVYNERISRQRGLFLMPTNSNFNFETNLSNSFRTKSIEYETVNYQELLELLEDKKTKKDIDMIKINIPQNLHRTILFSLRGMNITAETLFPGLDGLAKSLTHELIYK